MTLPVVPSNPSPYPRGTYSKIARELGVTPQAVRYVALGANKSERIAAALSREARRFARRLERQKTAVGSAH